MSMIDAITNDVELKNFKHSEFASQETNCYEASLYYKGKRIAVVSNDGHGGCDNQHIEDGEGYAALEAALHKANNPADNEAKANEIRRRIWRVMEMGDEGYCKNDTQHPDELLCSDPHYTDLLDLGWLTYSVESVCGELTLFNLLRKDYKRLISKRVVYLEDNQIFQTNTCKRPKDTLPKWIDHVREENPSRTILNTLPEKEALEIFRNFAA